MFYPELTELTKNAQAVIDGSCTQSNITVTISEHMGRLKEYIDMLDPTSIDFSRRDFIARHKIAAYWDRFRQLSDGLDKAIAEFEPCHRILTNTITTLTSKYRYVFDTIAVFKQQHMQSADIETLQQIAVAEQALCMLDNMIREYKHLLTVTDDTRAVSLTAFNQAILTAKMQKDFALFDASGYVENYKKARNVLES